MEVVKKILDHVLYWITVVLFTSLVIIVVWQIFSRQILQDPATWTDEGARLTFVWLGLFASASADTSLSSSSCASSPQAWRK